MSLKKQTLWSMAPLLVITALNLISIPLLYRFLGTELYALWFYVLSLGGMFGFADLGLGVAIGRYVGVELGRGDIQAARSYWATGNLVAIPLLLAMSAGFTIVGAVYGPRWFNVAPDNVSVLQWSFIAAGPGLFFSFYAQFWNILAQVNLDFKFVSLLRVVSNLIQVAGSIILAALTRSVLLLVVWASLLAAIQLLILVWHSLGKYKFGLHWKLARVARMFEMASYTTKTFLTLMVNNLMGGIDRLVLGRLAPPADFANYTICSNAGMRLNGLSVAVMGPIFGQGSRAVGEGGNRIARIYDEGFDFLFGWLVLASVWLTVWAHPVLLVWLGKNLGGSIEPILPPIVIAYCITALSNVSGAHLGPLDRVGAGLVIHIFAGILTVVCVYIGWQWGAVLGVAYGFLASRIAFICQDLFIIRLTKAKGWLDPMRWLHLCLQVGVGILFWLINRAFSPPLAVLLFLALLHGSIVAAWLVRKDFAALLSMVRPGLRRA